MRLIGQIGEPARRYSMDVEQMARRVGRSAVMRGKRGALDCANFELASGRTDILGLAGNRRSDQVCREHGLRGQIRGFGPRSLLHLHANFASCAFYARCWVKSWARRLEILLTLCAVDDDSNSTAAVRIDRHLSCPTLRLRGQNGVLAEWLQQPRT
jgi:hypothetical protein